MSDREFGSGDDFPDPREVFDRMKENMGVVWVVGGLIVVLVLGFASFFQVEPEEEAVVLRLGKPTGESYGPGLHFKIPFVDQVFKVATARQHRLEFGFRSDPGKKTIVRTAEHEAESMMLTGDLQLVHVRWSLIYQIENIETFVFEVKDQESTIRDVSAAIMRQLVGDYSLHELLTVKVGELETEALRVTQEALRVDVPTGIRITELAIRETDVPRQAKKIFNQFNSTEPKIRAKLDEAKTSQTKVTGGAEKLKKVAIGEARRKYNEITLNAEGEATAFLSQLKEFQLAPEITKQWMYLQAMQEVMSSVDDKLIIDSTGGASDGVLKLLPLTEMGGLPLGAPAPKTKVTK